MLCDEPDRSHHRYSTMLDLGDTQLPKALLVAHLGEPEWIKESKRLGGAELLGRLEERWLGGLPASNGPQITGPYFGVLITRTLLFRVLY